MTKYTGMLFCLVPLLAASASGTRLDTLIVEGLSNNSPAVVRNSFGVREGDEFSSSQLQDGVKKLYRLGLFRSVDVFIDNETDSSVSVIVEVEENPVCESVEFTGNKKLKERDLEEKITIQAGQVVTDVLVHENVRKLNDLYSEKGYQLAEITCELVETKTPGSVIVKFRVKEGKRVRIKDITFVGNTAFKEKKLKRKLKTKENRIFTSGDFDQKEYRGNLDTLLIFYHNEGYLDARVDRDSVWYGDNKKDIYIEIRIDEGVKYYAGDFYFTGNKIIDAGVLQKQIALKRGKPFDKSKFEMTKGLLSNAYREEGYLWMQMQEDRRYRGDTIDITFDVTEGLPAIVRKIDVTGNTKTREKVVRREFLLYPGQKYRQSRMERSIREVMQLNYFDNVSPDLRPNEDGTIDLVFDVTEKENIGQFSAGIMYSQLDGFGGNFSISIPNFRGAGQQLDANVDFSQRYKRFSLGFTEPWVFDSPTRFSANIYYRWQEYQTEIFRSYGFEIGTGRRLSWPDNYFRFYANYGLSREDVTRERDTVRNMILLDEGILSRVWLKLERNDTDVPTFPNSGSIFYVTTQVAGLGGDYRYVKGTLGYNWYFPLFWKFVLGTKTKFGLLGSFGDTLSLLVTDLFAAGDVLYDGVIRGYQQSFGGPYHEEQGGSLLTLSAELRFPILERQIYLRLFGDMGNTWSGLPDIDLADVYTGTGFGLSLLFPMIGLLDFDFAWGLNSPWRTHFNDRPKGFEFHFNMGRGF